MSGLIGDGTEGRHVPQSLVVPSAGTLSNLRNRGLGGWMADAVHLNSYSGLHRDGLGDDSQALGNALKDCIRDNRALLLGSGPIRINDAKAMPLLHNVALIGDGVDDIGPATTTGSTLFMIYDETTSPFRLGVNVRISGINVFYPNQDDHGSEPRVMPPLMTGMPGKGIGAVRLSNLRVLNCFDFLAHDSIGSTAGDITMQNLQVFAIRDYFRLRNVPEVIQISDSLFSWESLYPTRLGANALRDYSARNGAWVHAVGDGTPTAAITGGEVVWVFAESGLRGRLRERVVGRPRGYPGHVREHLLRRRASRDAGRSGRQPDCILALERQPVRSISPSRFGSGGRLHHQGSVSGTGRTTNLLARYRGRAVQYSRERTGQCGGCQRPGDPPANTRQQLWSCQRPVCRHSGFGLSAGSAGRRSKFV